MVLSHASCSHLYVRDNWHLRSHRYRISESLSCWHCLNSIQVIYICIGKLTIIGSDNGLLPGWRQAIIWTNAKILLIWPLVSWFSEILTQTLAFSFKKMRLKVLSVKWQPCCLDLNVLKNKRLNIVIPLFLCSNTRGYRNPFLYMATIHLSCMVSITVADDILQRAMA